MGHHSKPTDKSANKAKAISGSCVEDHTRYPLAEIAVKTQTPLLLHTLVETFASHKLSCIHTYIYTNIHIYFMHVHFFFFCMLVYTPPSASEKQFEVCEPVNTINNRANEKAIRCFWPTLISMIIMCVRNGMPPNDPAFAATLETNCRKLSILLPVTLWIVRIPS